MPTGQIVPQDTEVIESNMSEVWAARAIPYCPDARGRCLEAFIDLHMTTVMVSTRGCDSNWTKNNVSASKTGMVVLDFPSHGV